MCSSDLFALDPTGKRIASTTNYTGHADDEQLLDLYVRDLEPDSPAQKLIKRNGYKNLLRWSSDGASLAFVSSQDPHIPFSRDTLFVVAVPPLLEPPNAPLFGEEAEGLTTEEIVPQPDYDVKGYAWQAGTQNLFTLLANGLDTDLYRLALGQEPERIEIGEGEQIGRAHV